MALFPIRISSGKAKKSTFIAGVVFLVVALFIASSLGSFYLGARYQQYASSAAPGSILNNATSGAAATDKADFGIFWQAWNIINDKFYGERDAGKRVDGAISGMVSSLGDPYTTYFEPSANKLFQDGLQGSFGGIGAELTVKNGQLTIVSALQDTPAEKAGLKGGDVVTMIDSKKSADISFGDALNAIRGTIGTKVTLTIVRQGEEKPLEIPIERATITVKSVTTDTLGQNKNIAYIKLNQFGDDTKDLAKKALEDAKSSGKKGILIDLRGNPGGYLQTAVDLIGMVIPQNPTGDDVLKKKTAVIERFKDKSEYSHVTAESSIVGDIPLVVLVNEGSASASEIFSGAMKDYKRAQLVGTKTFGKGSVQQLQDLSNGGSIKVTIAKWFTPLGVGIDGKGIEPDVAVELPKDATPSTSDAQAAKAIELLEHSM